MAKRIISRGWSVMLGCALAGGLQAGDWEASLSYGFAYPGNRNVYRVNPDGTFLQTRLGGPWQQPALGLAVEVYRKQALRGWVRAAYAASNALDYHQVGQAVSLEAIKSEAFSGTLRAGRLDLGVGATYETPQLGEYGLSLLLRRHRLSLEGVRTYTTIQDGVLNTSTTPLDRNANVSDVALAFSLGLVQRHPTFKTFQRIVLAWGFGGDSGAVPADWQLGPAHLERLKPRSEFQFSAGIRL